MKHGMWLNHVESASSSVAGVDTSVASSFVEKLHKDLLRQGANQPGTWPQLELGSLQLKAGKDRKPSLVDTCSVLTLSVAHATGGLSKKDIVANVVNKLI